MLFTPLKTVLCAAGLAALLISTAMAADAGAGANWPNHNGAAGDTGYSTLDQIGTSTVGKLGLAWSLDLPGEVSLEGTPVAVDGIVYVTGTYAAVYAVDAVTGKLLWKYDPEMRKKAPEAEHYSFPVNRGVAYDKGRVFSASLDGRLFALDAKTGKLLWTVKTLDVKTMRTVTGAPRTFNGKVIIGQGGADFGARGYVTAYDQATGKQIWRFYTAPGSPEENKGDPIMEKAAATWTGEWWKVGTGGGVWNGITFDPELNRIYFGTANAGPWDADLRSPGGGDNLFTVSIVALDADTGKYVWHYQLNPREVWDYDNTQQISIGDLVIDGKPRKVLMQAPKNGFFYVLDRETGQLISAEKYSKATWAKRIDLKTGRPVEEKNVRFEKDNEVTVFPSGLGAHNWQDMSFNPKTGLVYIPEMQLGTRLLRGKTEPGYVRMAGVTVEPYVNGGRDGKGSLIAWDPVKQKARWQVKYDTLWNGGTMTTAGGLVFQGAADGYFYAYDAASGKPLWKFNASHAIIGGPASYSVNGKQYVSVLAGYGGATSAWGHLMYAGWKYGAQPRRILTFTLDGKSALPQTAPRDMQIHALDDPDLKIDPKDVDAGLRAASACFGCHGLHLESAGAPGPDLRESAAALDPEVLWSIVHNGDRVEQGMPKLDKLTKEQVQQIYMFIRDSARKAIAAEAGTKH
jgi:quinohemoprotein ethanol dehydrogenase